MNRWRRMGARLALALFIFCLLYAGAALDLSEVPINNFPEKTKGIPIFLRSDGGHLDLIFPVRSSRQDWTKVFPFPEMEREKDRFSYIAIGWGEKGFYLDDFPQSFPHPITTFRAATGLNTPVLRVAYSSQPVVNDTCRGVLISGKQYQKLSLYVQHTAQRDAAGYLQKLPTPEGEDPTVFFYKANGTYSIFNTCNTWVNSALKAAGLKACIWTPLARAVLDKYPLETKDDR